MRPHRFTLGLEQVKQKTHQPKAEKNKLEFGVPGDSPNKKCEYKSKVAYSAEAFMKIGIKSYHLSPYV